MNLPTLFGFTSQLNPLSSLKLVDEFGVERQVPKLPPLISVTKKLTPPNFNFGTARQQLAQKYTFDPTSTSIQNITSAL